MSKSMPRQRVPVGDLSFHRLVTIFAAVMLVGANTAGRNVLPSAPGTFAGLGTNARVVSLYLGTALPYLNKTNVATLSRDRI